MTINRRSFIQTAAAVTASLSAPMVMASGKPRVVVVGGGAGGATVARYIAKDSKGAIDVTLVEPSRTYYTCFFSNLYIGGFRDLCPTLSKLKTKKEVKINFMVLGDH